MTTLRKQYVWIDISGELVHVKKLTVFHLRKEKSPYLSKQLWHFHWNISNLSMARYAHFAGGGNQEWLTCGPNFQAWWWSQEHQRTHSRHPHHSRLLCRSSTDLQGGSRICFLGLHLSKPGTAGAFKYYNSLTTPKFLTLILKALTTQWCLVNLAWKSKIEKYD